MPSKNMLPKGQRRRTVKPEYRATRGVEETAPPPVPVLEFDEVEEDSDAVRTFLADPAAANTPATPSRSPSPPPAPHNSF